MTKHLFKSLIDYHSYILEFYSKSFEIWWTNGLKMALNVKEFRTNPFAGRSFALAFLGECILCEEEKDE